MNDRTAILRQLMKSVGISSFQILGDRAGMSRRAIDLLRKGNAATLRYGDLVKLAQILQIEVSELITKFIDESSHDQSLNLEIIGLREEYQRLQQKMAMQTQELRSQFQRESIQQLESLLLQLPTAVYASQQNPNLLAKNILPLFRPIEVMLDKWGITAIGSVGTEVIYDPQKHQVMEADNIDNILKEGDAAVVRYVGYRQGEKLLYKARVTPKK